MDDATVMRTDAAIAKKMTHIGVVDYIRSMEERVRAAEADSAHWAAKAKDARAALYDYKRAHLAAERSRIRRELWSWFVSERETVSFNQTLDRICPEAPGEVEPAPPPWQPIESAPKDGSFILVSWSYGPNWPPMVATWDNLRALVPAAWRDACGLMGFYGQPTHWMPLPAGPVAPQASTHEIPGVGPVTVPESPDEEV